MHEFMGRNECLAQQKQTGAGTCSVRAICEEESLGIIKVELFLCQTVNTPTCQRRHTHMADQGAGGGVWTAHRWRCMLMQHLSKV